MASSVNFATTTQNLFLYKADVIAKGLSFGVKWTDYSGLLSRDENQTLNTAGNIGDLVRWAHAPIKFVDNVHHFGDSTVKFLDDPSPGRFIRVIAKGASTIGPVKDATDFLRLTKIVDLGPIGQVSGPALITSMGYTACEKFGEIADSGFADAKTEDQVQEAFRKMTLALVEMVKSISHVATGIFICLAAFFALVVPLGFLIAGTVHIAATIFGHYYKNLSEPATQGGG